MKKTDILDVSARKLAPFILLYGCYVIAYGHLSPGGGFQGGVVLASGVILLALCHGVNQGQTLFPPHLIGLAETNGFLAFLSIGLFGLAATGSFLINIFPVSNHPEIDIYSLFKTFIDSFHDLTECPVSSLQESP